MCDGQQVWQGVDKIMVMADTSLSPGGYTCAVLAYDGSIESGLSNTVQFELVP